PERERAPPPERNIPHPLRCFWAWVAAPLSCSGRVCGGTHGRGVGGEGPGGRLAPEPRMPLTRNELLRKITHMGVGLIAFALRFLGPLWSAVAAAGALCMNLFLLPRVGGKRLWRDAEHAAGSSIGIVLYPLAVLLLVLIFWRRLEVAAASWGILAFGDGMASVAGMALGRRKLPWNPRKSWMGSLAYVLFGTVAAAVLLEWTAPGQYSWLFAVAAAFGTALLAAALESLPQGLDDNIGVPLVSALFLFGLLLTHGHWRPFLANTPGLTQRLVLAAVINGALAGLAYAARTVNLSGVIGGFLVGFAIFAALTDHPVLFGLAFAASFATAAADTASSEIGQLLGRRTFLITTFRPV